MSTDLEGADGQARPAPPRGGHPRGSGGGTPAEATAAAARQLGMEPDHTAGGRLGGLVRDIESLLGRA